MLATLLATALAIAPAPADVTQAKRLYTLGERHMAEGRATIAVELWKKAILALPATSDYDALRHDLVMRLGYGLLAASHETHDRRYLVEGASMLERYAERHTQLFGDSKHAKAERAEVYEQLYEIESRLAPQPSAETSAETSADDSPAVRDPDGETYRRKVRVRRRWGKTSVDDPKTREALASAKTNPETGLWMTMPELQPLTPARAYVRISGTARPTGKRGGRRQRADQVLAQAAVRSVRPALRQCFAAAFTRNPKDVVRTRVELTIGKDGRVQDAKVSGPAVIDARGNACVARRLAAARVPDAPARAQRLLVPVVFFWEDENFLDEANGAIIRDELDGIERPREMNHGFGSPMGPIDAPANLR